MKNYVILTVVTLSAVLVVCGAVQAGTEYADAVTASNPDVWYRISEDPAAYLDALVDSAGGDDNGTWGLSTSDATSLPSSGEVGPRPSNGFGGLEANISSGHAGPGDPLPDAHNLPAGIIADVSTVSVFFRTNVDHGNDARIFTTGSSDADALEIIIGGGNDNDGLVITTGTTSSDDLVLRESGTTDGDWHNVVMVRNGDDINNASLYLDGVDVTGSLANSGDSHGISDSTGHLGARHSYDSGWGTLDGGIDEVIVWDSALSGSQVSALYAAATIPEPSALVLAALGLAGIVAGRRRR